MPGVSPLRPGPLGVSSIVMPPGAPYRQWISSSTSSKAPVWRPRSASGRSFRCSLPARSRRPTSASTSTGTDFSFLESWPFLFGVLVLVVVLDMIGRRAGRDAQDRPPLLYALAALALALGALLAAGSVADHSPATGGRARSPGSPARRWASRPHARCSAVCAAASTSRRRMRCPSTRRAPRSSPPALSILFPPLAILVIAGLVWLLAGGRRRADEKYAGLRILR